MEMQKRREMLAEREISEFDRDISKAIFKRPDW